MKKGKRRIFRKRNVIIAIIVAIIASISMSFFVSCGDDEFITNPDVETITGLYSTALPTPTDGTLPSSYDAKTNAYYAFYAMNALDSFTTESSGETTTKVAFASVSQAIKAKRVICGDEVYKENVSHSTFKSVGVRTFVKGNNYVVHNASSVSSVDETTWEETASRISKEDFLSRYGFVANSITGYVLTDETILSAKFLGEKNGIYSYSYDLDVVKSTGKLALEMRTMAGSSSMPIFEKASLIIRMDSKWRVTEVETSSVYSVDLLGGVTCTESVVEKFSNYNKNVKVPNSKFFNSYVNAEITTPAPETLTATDYLMAGVKDYVNGEKPLNAKLELSGLENALTAKANLSVLVNIDNLEDLSARIDLKELSYGEISLKDILLTYKKGDIYLKAGDFKAITNLNEITGAIQKISTLLGGGNGLSLSSLTSLGGLDFASLLNSANLTEKQDSVVISLPITLSQTEINVNLLLTTKNQIRLQEITASIGDINAKITLDDSVVVPETGDNYKKITPVLELLDKTYIALSVELGDISAQVKYDFLTSTIDVVLHDLTVSGISLGDVKVKIKDQIAYVSALGLNAKVNLNELESIIAKISALTQKDLSLSSIIDLDGIDFKALIVSAINKLSFANIDNELNINTSVMGANLSLALGVSENAYVFNGICVSYEDLVLSATPLTEEIDAILDKDLASFNNISTLLNLIENNEINLKVNALGLDVDLSVNLVDFTILAKTEIYGETLYAKLKDQTVYLSFKGLNAYVNLSDINTVLNKLESLIGKVELPSFDGIKVESIINGLTITETDVITIATDINGIDVSVILDKTNGLTLSSVNVKLEDTTITATPSVKADYSGLQDTTYYNLVSLLNLIENNEINLKVNALGLDVDLSVNLVDFTILAKTEIYGETLYAKLKDQTVYLSFKGLNAYVNLSDINTVLNKLESLIGKVELPSFDGIKIESIINGLTITETDVITLSTDINGIDVSVILDKTNGLTLSSVNVKLEDTTITATPSVKADYSGLQDTTYHNLVSLLNLIDNNEINLKVNALGLDVDLNVNLVDFTILAKTELYGETLYAKLKDQTVYLSFKGLNAYVNLSDINTVLNKLESLIGKVELPSFDGVKIESIINGLTITETDVITLATDINGIDIDIVLDKTNGLTLSSVNVKLEDTTITAIPSVKADYSGLQDTTYHNLVSLLDILDENNKISISAQALGATIYATIDIVKGEILVKVDDFEILVDLNEQVAYARYPGVNFKLNLNDINFALNELEPLITRFISQEEFDSINLDAIKDISIEDIISSLTVTENESYITLSISIMDIVADITVDKAQNGLVISGGLVKMNAIEIPFTTLDSALDFKFDRTIEYIDLAKVVEMLAPSLRNILTLDNLYANMTAKIVMGNQIFEITECEVLITDIYSAPRARASLSLKVTTNKEDGTTTVSEHKITLYYLDPSLVSEGAINTYFTYNDMSNESDVFAGTFTTVNFYETLEIIKQIYCNMPELQDALKPFIVPDENGMPKFMDLNVDFATLINSAIFDNDILALDVNGKAVLPELNQSVLLNLFSQNGLLCLDVNALKVKDTAINLSAVVGEAPSGLITDDKFTFTPVDNAMNFSSINELLKALEKTSEKRHFYIDAKIDVAGTGLLSWLKLNDKVTIDIYLDVIDGKTYFKAIVDRKNVNLIVMDVWKDYSGTGYIYFDPDAQMIYAHNHYVRENQDVIGTLFGRPIYGKKYYTEHDEYLKYTVEEFSADPLTAIFDILRISDDLKNTINKNSGEEKASTATIENTFTGYTYNGLDTFNITLDLAPLTTDIKTATVTIKHDAEFNLTGLDASVNMINIIDLKLNATLQTSDTSYGTDVEAKAQASNPNFN